MCKLWLKGNYSVISPVQLSEKKLSCCHWKHTHTHTFGKSTPVGAGETVSDDGVDQNKNLKLPQDYPLMCNVSSGIFVEPMWSNLHKLEHNKLWYMSLLPTSIASTWRICQQHFTVIIIWGVTLTDANSAVERSFNCF